MSSTADDKNASTPTGVPYRPLPAPRDVSQVDTPSGVVDAITRQFDAGAVAVALHDADNQTARITTPDDVDVDGDAVVITSDDGETVRVPSHHVSIVAGTDAELAAVALDTRVEVTYRPQNSQFGEQTRTGTVTGWVAKRSGSVYKLVISTDAGGRLEVWTATKAVDKGSRARQRKVGHDATVDVLDENKGDA